VILLAIKKRGFVELVGSEVTALQWCMGLSFGLGCFVFDWRLSEKNWWFVAFVFGLIFGISLGRGFFLIFHLFKLRLNLTIYLYKP
jgi:hypothetical protein